MRILMLNPPFLPNFSRTQRSPAVTKSATLYYPIWLAYATGALEQAGHDVRLVDAAAENLPFEHLGALVAELQPHLIVIETSTPTIDQDVAIGLKLRGLVPSALVCAVGPHVSALPKETLNDHPQLDFVCVREYDGTLVAIAQALAESRSWRDVPGIAHVQNGATIVNPESELLDDLDRLPFVSSVYHKHLHFRNYFYAITRHPVVTIISGRGCPYKCHFCMWPQTLTGHRYRKRSVESVVEEFAYIEKTFPDAREIFVEDDTLTLDRRRTRELCEGLIRKGTKIRWTANARADVDFETLSAMKAAGCRLLCVGIESGVQQILDNIEKGTTIAKIEEFFRDAKRSGVLVHGCFMAGNQGETRETLAKTLELAKRLNPDTAQFFPLMVYPGTKAYRWAEERNLLRAQSWRDWLTEDGMHASVVDSEHLTHEELLAWCDRARREFYLRPSYMLRKLAQSIASPAEAGRTLKSLATFGKHLLTR